MQKKPSVQAIGIWVFCSLFAGAQTPASFEVSSAATGVRPVGVKVLAVSKSPYAVVANSGENSVSVFGVSSPPYLVQTLSGIPGPYGLAACGRTILVTSPADNSVSVLTFPEPPSGSAFAPGTLVGKIKTGPQPYAVSCGDFGVVANLGDNTLTVIDVATLTTRTVVEGVPGSRALTSIGILPRPVSPLGVDTAWVAGTEANIVTVVDLARGTVVRRIPLPQPTSVTQCEGSRTTTVCIASGGSVVAIDPSTYASVPSIQYTSVPGLQELGPAIAAPPYPNVALSSSPVSIWMTSATERPTNGDALLHVPGAVGLAVGSADSTYVLATSPSANRLISIRFVRPTESPQPPFTVTNAASYSPLPAAAGSLASLFFSTGAAQSAKASSLPLPTSLAGVTLRIGGTLSYVPPTGLTYSPSGSITVGLLFVGPSQINFQLPTGLAPSPYVQVQLTMPDGRTQLGIVTIGAASPGIFTISQDGIGQGSILNQDFSQNGSPQVLPGAKPASRGEVIHIYATGCGETTPTLAPGEPASASGNPLVITKLQPSITIGGQSARVLFSGLAPGFVGAWQIDAEVPQAVITGSVLPVIVSIGGQTSNTVTMAVQ